MHPFHFYSTVFPFFSAATFVAADTEFIGNQDRRISYSEEWELIPFDTGFGGTLSYNSKASGIASLIMNSEFDATGIEVHVLVQSPGQTVQISLDNQQHDVAVYSQPAWSNNSLDPSIPHALQVVKRNPTGQYISLDFILVTYYDPPSIPTNPVAPAQTIPVASITQTETTSKLATPDSLSPDSSSGDPTGAYNETNILSSRTTQSTWRSDPSTPDSSAPQLLTTASSTFPAQQSNTEPVLSGDKLAAVIAVCIVIPTLIIAGTFQYRRKKLSKRKAASTAYLESIATREHGPPHPPFSLMPPDDKFSDTKGLIHLGSVIGDSTHPPAIATAL